jgi:hypothetical protein
VTFTKFLSGILTESALVKTALAKSSITPETLNKDMHHRDDQPISHIHIRFSARNPEIFFTAKSSDPSRYGGATTWMISCLIEHEHYSFRVFLHSNTV